MRYISTYEAMRRLNCSRNHIRRCLEDGRLSYKLKSKVKRKVYLISYESLLRYLPVAKSSRRVGRELFARRVCRKPTLSKGYVLIHSPEHHRADQNGYVAEHILVMEQHLKRPLNDKEVVHHINRDKKDNRIENLKLYASRGEHLSKEHLAFRAAYMRVVGNVELEEKVVAFIDSLLLI